MKSTKPAKPSAARLRCAIYTRKSSDEGLEQSFNSLDAQREACEAYVLSQAHEGWTALPARYDDGGYSGGNMERPGLQKLLADIGRGAVDVVVVYKVDRLTRSLADFARIVDAFDGKGVSFVSVTQAFNTTTSMGRLTLNVLLSFAQFEREVTGERIRDKIAASKAKGMWMGGTPPLGYAPNERTLSIVEHEAAKVRHIFGRYLALRSVHALVEELKRDGVRSRPTKRSGEAGAALTRGMLYHLLSNRLYVGEIVHKDKCYPGQHPAIVDRDTFEAVAALLSENRRERKARPVTTDRAPLTGLVFDSEGRPLCPVVARNKPGRLYRYYVSAHLQQGGRRSEDDPGLRIAAPALESLVHERVLTLAPNATAWDLARRHLRRVEVEPQRVRLLIEPAGKPRFDRLDARDRAGLREDGLVEVIAPASFRSWKGKSEVRRTTGASAPRLDGRVDRSLVRGLARAHALLRSVRSSPERTIENIGADEGLDQAYVRRLVRLAFLAPDIQQAIVEGHQPAGLTLERLVRSDLPLGWSQQRRLLGFRPG